MTVVIFDCDGVLLDTELLAHRCELEGLLELGFQLSEEEYLDLTLGRDAREMVLRHSEEVGIGLPDHFWREMEQRQKTSFEKELVAVDGVRHAIEAIPTNKCVASNSTLERLHYTLGLTQLLPYFEDRIFSAEFVERRKPFPDVYLFAAEQMGTDPEKCIVIEDSLSGVEAATTAGMTVFAFGGGAHITPRLREKLQASDAIHFFDRMQDLPELISRYL